MRVMFTTFAARSHMHVQVPLAWALRSAGHDVCIASHPDLAEEITAAGLTAVAVGDALNQEARIRELQDDGDGGTSEPPSCWTSWPEILDISEQRTTKLHYDFVHGVFSVYSPLVFWYYARELVGDLVEFARQWRPDLVVWDTMTFAGPVAALASGAAHARLVFGLDVVGRMRETYLELLRARPPELREDPVAEMLALLLQPYGLRFTEEAVVGQWTIDPFPPSLRLPVGHHQVPVRYVPYHGPATIPDWLREPPKRPRICLTLGVSLREVFGNDRVRVADLLEAVADLDAEVVATFNAEQLTTLTRVPDNVRTVDFVPLDALLPTCAAIVHHGGSGSCQTALWHGVPQVVVPAMMWDTTLKARRLAELGVGLYVPDVDRFEPRDLRRMLTRVLTEPSFAAAAARLRGEMRATPTPSDIVPVLERLTDEHRPSRSQEAL